ncbi:MAG: DUF1631 domain-containing protein, partial [Aestuariibacter sp.]|nr:DUF1631 domain-containing protein [Aestuariibacter sp.]
MVADTNNTQFSSSNSKNMTYKAVSKYALNGLSDLIRVLMENIDDALFELAEKAQNDNERNLYFEAMREIRIKRSLLQQGFDQAMENCFETVSRSQVHSAATPQETDELSLVELRDIEDSIAIDNMISKARPGFEDELFAVLERLKAVLPQTEIDEDTNPFDPRAICQSFHKASEILDTGIQIKLIFYKLFDKYVISNLGHFYGEMNQFFIDKGILPGLKASDERLKQSTKFMTNRMKKSGRQSTVSALDESMHSTGDATTDGGLLSALQQVMSTDAAAQNPSSAPEAGSGLVSSDGRGANISILPMAQNDAYMSELTNLQMLAPEKQPALNANPDNVHQEMRQKLVAFNQQSDHQTNDADNQIIDIVSMLFDFFLEDSALPDPTKVLIGRLQIPILKAAIIDNNFFNHKKHPARQLLDCMSKISLGWGEDSAMEAKLTGKMESVVNYVLEEFDQDISVFETALENLNQLIATETSNVEIANE